jgi:hypothetical protein
MTTEIKWAIAELIGVAISSGIGTALGFYTALWQNGLI